MNALIIGQNTKLANVFKCMGCNVYMVVDSTIKNFRPYKENTMYNILYTKTNITSIQSILPRIFEIIKWIHCYNINIVYTNEKYSMIATKFATYFIHKKPLLLSTSHNSYAWIDTSKVKTFSKILMYSVDGYVALASFVHRKLLVLRFPNEKLLLMPNSIEYNLFKHKTSYEINSQNIKCVYTATIYPGKAQDIILKALLLSKNSVFNVTVDFIGDIIDSEYKKELDKFIIENGLGESVAFKGRVDNSYIKEKLCTYDVYLCPSLMEMSPYNVLEAKAAALPIIATNVGGIIDLIKNGFDGLLIKPASAIELWNGLQKILEDEKFRQSLGFNALKNVSTVQSPETSAKKLKAFIDCRIRDLNINYN